MLLARSYRHQFSDVVTDPAKSRTRHFPPAHSAARMARRLSAALRLPEYAPCTARAHGKLSLTYIKYGMGELYPHRS